jgi:hypothetical protein
MNYDLEFTRMPGRPASGSAFRISALAVAFCLASIVAPLNEGAQAVEKFETTAGLVRSAPYVAHVRVLGSRSVPGVAALEYELEVLEVFKGRLPGRIQMRMLSGFQVVNPGAGRHPTDSEWVVFLGRGQAGLYPIRSLQWGRIDVATHGMSGEQYLMKRLSGFPAPTRGNYHSLLEFRELAKKLLSGQQITGAAQ